jgi:hypothetical protein
MRIIAVCKIRSYDFLLFLVQSLCVTACGTDAKTHFQFRYIGLDRVERGKC